MSSQRFFVRINNNRGHFHKTAQKSTLLHNIFLWRAHEMNRKIGSLRCRSSGFSVQSIPEAKRFAIACGARENVGWT
jgi:hypothetical protein